MKRKNKEDRKVNKNVRALNRQLRQDVFGDRFEARQIKKNSADGITFYQYILIDHNQPERNEILPWMNSVEIHMFNAIWIEMNRFIVTSDFWSTYQK